MNGKPVSVSDLPSLADVAAELSRTAAEVATAYPGVDVAVAHGPNVTGGRAVIRAFVPVLRGDGAHDGRDVVVHDVRELRRLLGSHQRPVVVAQGRRRREDAALRAVEDEHGVRDE